MGLFAPVLEARQSGQAAVGGAKGRNRSGPHNRIFHPSRVGVIVWRCRFADDNGAWMRYFFGMSFTEVLAELPALTVSERQLLVRRALDLDEPGLSTKDLAVVEKRLEQHRRNPASAVPLEEMKFRLHAARHDRHWQRRI
jgi:hypothetical protein